MSSRSNLTEESVKIKKKGREPLKYAVIPWATPWALGFVTLPLGAVLNWQAHSPGMAVLVTVCAGTLTWITFKTWSRRHEHTRYAATAMMAGLSGWLVASTVVDPGTRPMVTAWVVLWAMLSLTWNIRHGAITSQNKHDQPSNREESAWRPIRNLKKSRTTGVKTTPDGAVRITVQHSPGEATTEDVQAGRKNIASRFAVDDSAVSVSKVPGRADRTYVTVRPDSPTKAVVTWPGLSAPGRSIADAPVRIGVRADNSPLAFWMTGDDTLSRPAPHTLWTGMTGSGKTESYVTAVLEMRSRTDCVPVVGDPVKFMIDFGDVADAFGVAADGPDQTAQLIRNLPETLRYRASLIGRLGYKQWVPECYTKHGIPLVPVHIEEAASALANNEAFNEAMRVARALGMPISAAMQVAVFRSLPREARAQFGNSLAHGVKEAQDARFALTDATLNAGADPTRWGANHPGRMYAEVVGVPEEQWAMECRAFKVTLAEKRASLDATRPHWAQMDPGTFERLSKGIDVPDLAVLDEIGSGSNPPAWIPPDSEADTVKLVKGPAGVPDPFMPGSRPSTDDAREMIGSRIDQLEMRGAVEVVPSDFSDLVPLLQRDRTWVYIELDRQASAGRLARIASKDRRYSINRRASNGRAPAGV
jgi:hypothetical protein